MGTYKFQLELTTEIISLKGFFTILYLHRFKEFKLKTRLGDSYSLIVRCLVLNNTEEIHRIVQLDWMFENLNSLLL